MENSRLLRKRLVGEVRKECAMRMKVWKMADSKNRRFLKLDHQVRFEQMVHIGKILNVMTDFEYEHFCNRVELEDKKKEIEENRVVRDLFTGQKTANGTS